MATSPAGSGTTTRIPLEATLTLGSYQPDVQDPPPIRRRATPTCGSWLLALFPPIGFYDLINQLDSCTPKYTPKTIKNLKTVVCANTTFYASLTAIASVSYTWFSNAIVPFTHYAFTAAPIALACLLSLQPIFSKPKNICSYLPFLLNLIALTGALFVAYVKYCPIPMTPLNLALLIIPPLSIQLVLTIIRLYKNVKAIDAERTFTGGTESEVGVIPTAQNPRALASPSPSLEEETKGNDTPISTATQDDFPV